MVETTTTLCPQIHLAFRSDMLTASDPIECARKEIEKLKSKALAKYGNGKKLNEFNDMCALFQEIYEWQKAEKAYNEKTTKEIKERSFVSDTKINNLRGELGKVLRKFSKEYDF